MAFSIAFECVVKAVSLAAAAGGDGREHVLLEPTATTTDTLLNGGPIKLVIDGAGLQGNMAVDDVVTVTISAS